MRTTWSPDVTPGDEPRGAAMTLEEWADRDEDAQGELVDGFLVEEEVPDVLHEAVVAWLVHEVRVWIRPRGGFVFASQFYVRISDRTGRIPDVAVFFSPPRRGGSIRTRERPDIIVEIVSPRPRDQRRDRVEKMTEYARAGIQWYWLFDPSLGSFEVFELTANGRYERALAVTEGVADAIPGCEGLSLDLDELSTELASFPPPQEDD